MITMTRWLDLSVIMPVHNEASMLQYTFPSLLRLKAGEYIILLDRCSDYSRELIYHYWNKYRIGDLIMIEVKEKSSWRYHLSYLYDYGIRQASKNYILLTQADVILDVDAIRHNYRYPWLVSYRNVYTKLYDTFLTKSIGLLKKGFSGTLSMPRDLYFKRPLSPNDPLEFDVQLKTNFKYYKFVKANNLNLRPYQKHRLMDLGMTKRRMGQNILKVFLWSLVRLKPLVFVGYLKGDRE